MQSDISEPAFKAWLLKNAYEVVGNRSDPNRCAYARFLMYQGYVRPCVGVSGFTYLESVSVQGPRETTPVWLRSFIVKFDAVGVEYIGSAVTGAEALKYLEVA